jgi:hypothetical protein
MTTKHTKVKTIQIQTTVAEFLKVLDDRFDLSDSEYCELFDFFRNLAERYTCGVQSDISSKALVEIPVLFEAANEKAYFKPFHRGRYDDLIALLVRLKS